MQEHLGVKYALCSFIDKLSGYSIKWFTDNQKVVQVMNTGSRKQHVQSEVIEVHDICLERRISIDMEWIPRSENEQSDVLNKIIENDDWGIAQHVFYWIDSI